MGTIGIVGAGIAGLHLALYLQKRGVPVTLYTDRAADVVRASKLPSSVALMGATLARDVELGTNHWDKPELGTYAVDLRVVGDPPLAFRGKLAEPFLFIDMRLYLPRLMGDFEARGGKLVVATCTAADASAIAEGHDLLVVATGRDGLASLFPRVPERSPYEAPQRRLLAGIFRGVRLPSPFAMQFNIVPGHGEIFENQFLTEGGHKACFLVEAVPGGALEPLTTMRYEEDPAGVSRAMLAILKEHAKEIYARVDPSAFAMVGARDMLAGAIVPTARRGWSRLSNGRLALALGDAHVTHDPITGQGANAASRAAWLLGRLLAERAASGLAVDEPFCVATGVRLWEDARATTEWTNAALQPPPPHVVELLVAAVQNSAVADAFVRNFNDPGRQWEVLSSPRATAAFLAPLTHGAGSRPPI
jgi:2-polyprenyl-6-methoxyphenol hydroxylase-like FAD-dependent oxidoreductase